MNKKRNIIFIIFFILMIIGAGYYFLLQRKQLTSGQHETGNIGEDLINEQTIAQIDVTDCGHVPATSEEAFSLLKDASRTGDIKNLICLNLPENRDGLKEVFQAIEANGLLPNFLNELQEIKESYRTNDYIEYEFVRIEDGEPTTYTIYLWNVPGIGWQFDGL